MLAKVIKLLNERGGAVSVQRLIDYLSRDQGQPISKEAQDLQALETYVARDGVSGNLEVQGGTVNLERLDVATPEDRALATQLMQHVAEAGRAKHGFRTNPYYHFVLSWREGEHPSGERARDAVDHALQALGMAENQAFFVIHRDTGNEHLHCVVNRVHPEMLILTGPPRYDYFVLDKACREIELAQGWQHDYGPHVVMDGNVQRLSKAKRKELGLLQGDKAVQSQTPAARMSEKHTGVPAFADWMRTRVGDDLVALVERGGSWNDFHLALAERGIRAEFRGGGLVFATAFGGRETSTKASGVHYSLSLGRLEKAMGAFRTASELHEPEHSKTYASFAENVMRGVEPGLEYPGSTGKSPEREKRRITRQEERDALLLRYQAEKERVKRTAKDRSRAILDRQKREKQDVLIRLKAQKPERLMELERECGSKAVARGLWAAERASELELLQVKHKIESAENRRLNRMEWPDWLTRQAEQGDKAAVAALRGIRYREQRKANKSRAGFEGEELSDEFKPAEASKAWKGVESKGQGGVGGIWGTLPAFALSTAHHEIDRMRDRIVYRDDAGNARMTDHGHRVDIHRGMQDVDAISAGLRLSAEKFGGEVYITGSAEFRERAAREAARMGIRVADQDLQAAIADERQRTAHELQRGHGVER